MRVFESSEFRLHVRRSVPCLNTCDLIKQVRIHELLPLEFEIYAVDFDIQNPWSVILIEKRVYGEDLSAR
jgi:hypothetical protein